jgi:hypothetical protein
MPIVIKTIPTTKLIIAKSNSLPENKLFEGINECNNSNRSE